MVSRFVKRSVFQGKSRSSIKISRRSTDSDSLILRTWTVTRPMFVFPTRMGPSQPKCWLHRSFRGCIEANDTTWNEVETRQIRALMAVAMKACECQFVGGRCSSMLLGDDVIEFEIHEIVGFGNPAIFTASPGSRPHKSPQLFIHPSGSADRDQPVSTSGEPWRGAGRPIVPPVDRHQVLPIHLRSAFLTDS